MIQPQKNYRIADLNTNRNKSMKNGWKGGFSAQIQKGANKVKKKENMALSDLKLRYDFFAHRLGQILSNQGDHDESD